MERTLNIEQLHNECLLESLSDPEMRQGLQALNRMFTVGRDDLRSYALRRELVTAYSAFYLPTNAMKLTFMLSQLGAMPWAGQKQIEVLDFGCGPGTFSFALAPHLPPDAAVEFHMVDTSPIMQEQARRIQQVMFPRMRAQWHRNVPRLDGEAFKVAIFGNVVNETGPARFETLIKETGVDAVFLVEPGTSESFAHTSRIRRFMQKKGYVCSFPCPGAGKCPALAREGEWCHQVLRASLHPAVERLGQLAGLDRKVQPFIGHVYTRDLPPKKGAQLFRLKKKSKHAFHWELCTAGTTLKLMNVELPMRGLSKSVKKEFDGICAGAYVPVRQVRELDRGVWRVELDETD